LCENSNLSKDSQRLCIWYDLFCFCFPFYLIADQFIQPDHHRTKRSYDAIDRRDSNRIFNRILLWIDMDSPKFLGGFYMCNKRQKESYNIYFHIHDFICCDLYHAYFLIDIDKALKFNHNLIEDSEDLYLRLLQWVQSRKRGFNP
jgi:hypothetical protein